MNLSDIANYAQIAGLVISLLTWLVPREQIPKSIIQCFRYAMLIVTLLCGYGLWRQEQLNWMTKKISFPIWVLFLICIGVILLLQIIKVIKRSDNRVPLTDDDIFTRLYQWWPKIEGMFPDDVHIDFLKVDKELSLPFGSTKKHIGQVANKKGFKKVSGGEHYAIYECNPMDAFQKT